MPQSIIQPEHGRHALLMIRIALLGLSKLENGQEQSSDNELRDVRALASSSIVDSIRLLDLYLTGELTRRFEDGPHIVDLVHNSIPWNARLSNEVGSVLIMRKPSSEDLKKGKQCVVLDFDSPVDDQIRRRWKKIDQDARPDNDLQPLGEQIFALHQGKGFGKR